MNIKRGLKIAGLSLLAVLLVLVASVSLVLGTQSGSQWALARVPGLQLENFQGRLGGQWSADRLLWVQGEDRVEVRALAFDWTPGCLLKMTLCIDRLNAENVMLHFAPGTEPARKGPMTLPTLKLPLAIELKEVQLGRLQLDGIEQLRDLKLAAHWTAQGLQIDRAHLQRDEMVLDLNGLLDPAGDWPLTLTGHLQLPPQDGKPWALALDIQGDLLKTLQLKADSSGYLTGGLSGELQPLAEHLPARLKLTSDRFKPSAGLPETIQLDQLLLTAEGNLDTGYQINGTASLPAEKGPMTLALQGLADAKGATIEALNLAASEQQRLRINGKVNWENGFSADATVDWLDFPWQRLYPLESEPQVALHAFKGDVSYTDGKYLGNFNASLNGPAGAFTVVSPFSGDLQRIYLPQLEVVAGQGKASGHLNLQFADGIGWDTALDLSSLDPSFWVAELPGTLAGPLRSKGQLKNEQLELTADLDLKGRLRGQPAVLQAKADGRGQQWNLPGLSIRLGDNRIEGRGSLDQRLQGQLDLNLPRLGQLWPRLQGQAKGRLDLAGTLKAPQGQLNLQGSQLAFQDNRLQSLAANAKLDAAQRATISVKGSGIQAGDTALGTLTLDGQGTLKTQQLKLDLQGPLLKLALALDGTLDNGNWRGRLASGNVQSGGQAWRLQQPAKIERLADGKLNVGAHCWLSGNASLCGEDQRLMPEPRLRYHLKNFPLESLAQWMPRDFAWKGSLNADVQLDVPAAGPNGQITVDAGGGTLRVRDKEQWLDFPYQTLRLTSTLTPKRIDSRLDFDGAKLGRLLMSAQIDPLSSNKALSGEFSLSGLDLSVARPFAPMVEKLNGRLNGSGRLSGGLLAPLVNGSVTLQGGEVSGPELPLELRDLNVQALIAGENVQVNGSWKSGSTGQGSLTGQVAWGQALVVDLSLKGSRLPIHVEPYAEVEAAPDLKISMQGERLAVSGKVLIPKGTITVRELPPSTVKLSGDTVIVGQQTEEGAPPLAVAMDIDVEVGQDTLSFNGFGLTADLVGRVHIGDNLDTRGELNLNNGRYRAYGQRLTIRKARLLFAGPVDQPYLDIEAIRQTDDVIAGIRLTGSAEQPTTEVFSEPAMSQEQALSYLVMGRPLGNSGEDNNMVAQAALALGVAGSASTTGKLAGNLGIKDFELDTSGTGDKTNVVASGKITDKLSLRYGVGVFEPANTIALRYLLSKRVYLEAASGIASSLDIFYKRDF
ncbi:translocation/assembly module TamB domain-containing protein [Pseudomonas alliivorans]|uniref:translocation/assembly module TamB domain-containing protein n=1 Tax=Pseudomonas alliivorans TaxID=2810613 RepID=UPI001AE562BF|nr:translocation/assembly module TamB domain-containing protein [Pseudomonas alliivorans]MBP0941493.1 translocation/assembly module TamB [Pseudomonas alliivorans]MEE4879586.1 translocation/assembly module TamB domain-containing protein [Pseudomonas alliivorans]MEE4930971.1 translocation/assembly module TamB domain-containing protein [Pseudomonas alliivorans]MEE4936245.1 translocation/assembly module TamB domain-containing protein [Pseudomonas alliivorans]MEE4941189.1 translocation/assembly mod